MRSEWGVSLVGGVARVGFGVVSVRGRGGGKDRVSHGVVGGGVGVLRGDWDGA